jgi:hypothetical protein
MPSAVFWTTLNPGDATGCHMESRSVLTSVWYNSHSMKGQTGYDGHLSVAIAVCMPAELQGLLKYVHKQIQYTVMSDKCTLMRQNCRKKSDDTAGKSSLLRSWGDKDPLKRPSCALLVTLAQTILRHADAHTLTTVVSSRQASCLHKLLHTDTSHTFWL